jgi:hypothetical protein
MVDAWFAVKAAVEHPSWWRVYLASLGLSVPTAVVVALLVAIGTMLIHPDGSPSIRKLIDRLRPADVRRKARLAVVLLMSPPVTAVWLLLVARASLFVLGTNGSDTVLGLLSD